MTSGSESITLADIKSARKRLANTVARTPTILSESLTRSIGAPVWLKLENRQITGSFKLRGATNAVRLIAPDQARRGVVATSTGNHGRALAFAAQRMGLRAIICLSRLVPENKVREIQRLGAEVRVRGANQDEAQEEAERLVAVDGMIMIPPFDDKAIISGQGTLGLEIVEDVPDVCTIVVPISGGGLAAGVGAAVRALRSRVRVVGVSMSRGAAMKASLDAGEPVLIPEQPSLADSLGGGIGLHNQLTFAMCREVLDDVVLVSEDEIADAVAHAYAREREILEGAGAVGIAALLSGKVKTSGPLTVLLSGCNIDLELHRRIVSGERGIVPKAAA
jgi:threonine dehydratase